MAWVLRTCAPVVFIALALSSRSLPEAALVVAVTELQRNPVGLESAIPGGRSHEFVEIANLGSEALSLDSLFLSDGLDADSVIPWPDTRRRHPNCHHGVRVLRPGQVAIILDPDYDSALSLDPSCALPIADSTVLWAVGDDHLGDYSNLSETDGVFLYVGTAALVRRVVCWAADTGVQVPPEPGVKLVLGSAGAAEGQSLVARSLLFGQPTFDPCPRQVSPGLVECVRDGWMCEARYGAFVDGALACTLAVLRVGAPGARVSAELRQVAVPASSALTQSARDPSGATRFLGSVTPGAGPWEAVVSDSAGQSVWRLDLSSVWVEPGSVRVSEVFPRAGSDGPEWFELHNQAPSPVSLDGWMIGDDEDSVALGAAGLSIDAGSYAVFTGDRTAFLTRFPTAVGVHELPDWHTLGNLRDTITLWDNCGARHEQVCYDVDWVGTWERGSLERVSLTRAATGPGAWAPAWPPSPGQPNGTVFWRAASRPTATIGPIPFTPNGDGRDDWLSIALTLPAGAEASVEILGMDGRVVRRCPQPPQRELRWDGRSDAGAPAPAGPFFVVIRAQLAGQGEIVIRKKGVLWR